jgi:hypothetical protein
MQTAERLLLVLTRSGLPAVGVSIGRADDKTTWRVDYEGKPSAEQVAVARQVIDAFDIGAQNVPLSITPYQARLALNSAGLREAAEAAIAVAPQDVRDAWEYALSIERSSPFISAVGTALALSDVEIDRLFVAAQHY